MSLAEWTYSYAFPDGLTSGATYDIRARTFVSRCLVFLRHELELDKYVFVRPDGSCLSIPGESFMWHEVRPAQ